MSKYSTNPILKNDLCVCDVEAKVFGDRIYLYGTNLSENAENFRIYSSNDMKNWVDHGVAFSIKDVKWIEAKKLWAPDCIYRNGKYYLFYSLPNGEMGVAKSDFPFGPFEDVGKVNVNGIDPSVLVDEDKVYIYWGQLDNVRGAILKDNMMDIEENSIMQPLSVKEHQIHEGSSVKKINGKYYYVYTDTHRRGKATCQGYSISDNPLFGFKYKNIIIDCFDCDPESWNNHGCIQQFKGEWYIFYHRAIGSVYGWNNPRQVCIEKIKFDKKGNIKEVLPTSSGVNEYIYATEVIKGCSACSLSGGAYIAKESESAQLLSVKNINPHASLTFRYIKFSNENNINIKLKGQGKCRIDIYIDDKYHDYILVEPGMFFNTFNKQIHVIKGKRTIEFKFYGLFKNLTFDEFSFNKI